jgi:hypothetical protein
LVSPPIQLASNNAKMPVCRWTETGHDTSGLIAWRRGKRHRRDIFVESNRYRFSSSVRSGIFNRPICRPYGACVSWFPGSTKMSRLRRFAAGRETAVRLRDVATCESSQTPGRPAALAHGLIRQQLSDSHPVGTQIDKQGDMMSAGHCR